MGAPFFWQPPVISLEKVLQTVNGTEQPEKIQALSFSSIRVQREPNF